MTTEPPQGSPPPDQTAQQWPGYPAQPAYPPPTPAYPPTPGYPPAPGYPPSTEYPPSSAMYAPPQPAPAYPSMPLGAPYPAPGYGQPAYPSMPMGSPYMTPAQSGLSGQAIASIICASVGALLVLGGFLLGALASAGGTFTSSYERNAMYPLFGGVGGLLALPLSIAAVVTGHLALSKIKRSGGAVSGHSAALAGVIMGYVEIAVPIISFIVFFALAVASTSNGG
ncbi:MAG TPA: DUF4190 domain-containing protein [Ktedonobacterales bacterium]